MIQIERISDSLIVLRDGGTLLAEFDSANNVIRLNSTVKLGVNIISDSAAELAAINGLTASVAELNLLDGVTASTSELNIVDGVTATAAELNILDGVTAGTAEINILDGVTATAAELNILDGVTSTAAEINILDGVTKTAAQINTLVEGVAGGYKVARGAVALDGTNPTTVATGLATIVAAFANIQRTTALTTGTAFVTVNFTGSDGNLDIYGFVLAGTDSTGTETVEWLAIGT